jgi:large subunit ribosomal protein L30
MAENKQGKLRVTLVKSPIGFPQNQKDTVKALGLKKLHKTVEKPDNDAIRGQIKTVRHLVEVEEV